MALRVKVNNKHQLSIPAPVRAALDIKPGDHLLVDVRGIGGWQPEEIDVLARQSL